VAVLWGPPGLGGSSPCSQVREVTLRFSVIIPTLNRREMLRSAIRSVREQRWEEIEILVVDGGSEDGTFEDFVRQPDIRLIQAGNGVYDALNVGFEQSTGDIIGLLNSDDAYETRSFGCVANAFEASPWLDAVCGSALLVAGDRIVTILNNEADKALKSPRTALIGFCMPNARFFRRAAMKQTGPFDTGYHYIADRDWLLRWYEAGLKTGTIPDVVYRYRQHSGSLTLDAERRNQRAIRAELLMLARRWQTDPRASEETRRIARSLEGRNLAKLALISSKEGDFGGAGKLLFERDGALSLIPLLHVSQGVIDWLAERRGSLAQPEPPYS
jgi:glycosyltransferase involved in cell wall biosynthesis